MLIMALTLIQILQLYATFQQTFLHVTVNLWHMSL